MRWFYGDWQLTPLSTRPDAIKRVSKTSSEPIWRSLLIGKLGCRTKKIQHFLENPGETKKLRTYNKQ